MLPLSLPEFPHWACGKGKSVTASTARALPFCMVPKTICLCVGSTLAGRGIFRHPLPLPMVILCLR